MAMERPFPSRNLVYSAAATAISSLFKVRPSFLSPGLPSQSNTPKALSYHLASTPFMSSNDGGRSLRRSMPHSTPTLSTRCIAAKGDESNECGKFARYYRSLCPGEWMYHASPYFMANLPVAEAEMDGLEHLVQMPDICLALFKSELHRVDKAIASILADLPLINYRLYVNDRFVDQKQMM
ncbi:hypothetical protein Nepgr_020082 [Nepenthes gracilis]|uniref:Uncharacterized protein n=1 Tax=Nepenthes gracilis TaxID=150966 RepID=A0AAD3XW08_NEPGR|nr:hypothetical protein Nepgr_020082 [Nepenthes gracilis]